MTYTGKIRGYLILVALISPAFIMLVIYFHSIRQLDLADKNSGKNNLEKFDRYHEVFKAEMVQNAEELILTPLMRRVIHRAKLSRTGDLDISGLQTDFDFVEILDDSGRVMASYHRPGLISQYINDNFRIDGTPDSGFWETEEYDINGRHAAFTQISSIDSGIFLYTGKYIDSAYIKMVEELISARLNIRFPDDTDVVGLDLYNNMRSDQLYQIEGMMLAILAGGEISDFFLTAEFESTTERELFRTLLAVAGAVALVSVLIAILLGWLITGRIKREVDNLIIATSQIAAGDLTTPVISYEAGEFMQLANSFSNMKSDLKQTQSKLATSEKIAAWKAIGQKIAHEVKNPLTPISISIDDLQKSYYEKLPDFDKTLDETVDVVKVEIKRLTKMLDQFAAFARMAPPVIDDVKPVKLIDDIKALYKREVDSGELRINNSSQRNIFRIDHERIRQLLINLIKNGFESSLKTSVRIDFNDTEKGIEIKIEDNGPGFPENILESGFKPYSSTKEGGSGLGLVICQRIVYDSGGTIELYNREEGGAGLIIDLPFDNG